MNHANIDRKDVGKLFHYTGWVRKIFKNPLGGFAAPQVGGHFILNLTNEPIQIVLSNNLRYSVKPIGLNGRRLLLYQLYEMFGVIDQTIAKQERMYQSRNNDSQRNGIEWLFRTVPAQDARYYFERNFDQYGFHDESLIATAGDASGSDRQLLVGRLDPDNPSTGYEPSVDIAFDIMQMNQTKLINDSGLNRERMKAYQAYSDFAMKIDADHSGLTNAIRTSHEHVFILSEFGNIPHVDPYDLTPTFEAAELMKDNNLLSSFEPTLLDGATLHEHGFYYQSILSNEIRREGKGLHKIEYGMTIGYGLTDNKHLHFLSPVNSEYLSTAGFRVIVPSFPSGCTQSVAFIRMGGICQEIVLNACMEQNIDSKYARLLQFLPDGNEREVLKIRVEDLFNPEGFDVEMNNQVFQVSFHLGLNEALRWSDRIEERRISELSDQRIIDATKEKDEKLADMNRLLKKYQTENAAFQKKQEEEANKERRHGLFGNILTAVITNSKIVTTAITVLITVVIGVLSYFRGNKAMGK